MNNPPQELFLDENYTIQGVNITGAEIQEALINSAILKKHLKE